MKPRLSLRPTAFDLRRRLLTLATAMRASSLFFVGIPVAFISIAPANAQDIKKPIFHQKHEKPVLRQAKDRAPVQIFCNRSTPCRPVRKGCHLEPQSGGFNEEVCN
jgi:hypothetical protein